MDVRDGLLHIYEAMEFHVWPYVYYIFITNVFNVSRVCAI